MEQREWAVRAAVIEKARVTAAAEKARLRARREAVRRHQTAMVSIYGCNERSRAALALRGEDKIRDTVQKALAAKMPRGHSVGLVLRALRWEFGESAAEQRSALRRAKAFYHPDAAHQRTLPMLERLECEEICKVLNALKSKP